MAQTDHSVIVAASVVTDGIIIPAEYAMAIVREVPVIHGQRRFINSVILFAISIYDVLAIAD